MGTQLLAIIRRREVLLASAALVALAVAGTVLGVLLTRGGSGDGAPPELLDSTFTSTFTMTAEEADAIGVELGTGFILTSEEPTDDAFLRSFLRVDPEVELDVRGETAQRFRIQPMAELEPGRVYRFSLGESEGAPRVLGSWAFQTKSPIAVVQTLPRDEATQVPLNTGIELTFSHDGVQGIEEHFAIDPPVAGRFEVHKRVVVFVPEELSPATLYTVTLRAGAGVSGSQDTMANDFAFQFETGDITRLGEVQRVPVLNFTRKMVEAATNEAPAFELYTSEQGAIDVPVEVYRYAGLDGFLAAMEAYQSVPSWASVSRETYLAETDGLELVTTVDATVERLGQSGTRFLPLPEALPAGFYLVQAEFRGKPIQAWLQVTDVATYLSVSKTKTLVWVNDLASKAPIPGASIDFLSTDAEATTDGEGIAFVDTPAVVTSEQSEWGYVYTRTSGNVLITAPDGRQAVVPLDTVSSGYYGYSSFGFRGGDDYWTFLSTDRPLYLPSDTVRFWGVAKHRENPGSETFTVELTGSDYFDYYYRPVRIAETEVTTSSLGTFTGELSFEGMSPGYYTLNVKQGDLDITSIGVSVETYTKPAYTIDVTPSKQAIIVGEEVELSVKTAFLEGSPVPELGLRYFSEKGVSTDVTTDERGELSVAMTPQEADAYGWSTSFVSFTPVLAEEGEITGETWIQVHPSSLTIASSSDLSDDGRAAVEGTVHNLDLSRINDGTAEAYDDFLGEPAGGVQVSARVIEVDYVQREVGEYYDFIAKIVRKRYEYDRVTSPVGSFTPATNANGEFQFSFAAEDDKEYEIELAVTDSAGRTSRSRLYQSGTFSNFNARSNLVYLTDPRGPESDYYYGGTSGYEMGEEVVLQMRRGAEELPAGGDNRYMFYQAQNGIRDYEIQTNSTLSFPFSDAQVPSTSVMGAWFNGRTYLEVRYEYRLQFDPAERALDIEVTPDKERYEPGDEARLDVRVTDIDGNAQDGAEVNLAVVDEAIFQIQGPYSYTPELLPALYAPVGSGILRTYASHQYPNDEQAAERGGGGDVRRDFADVAFYGSVTTDSDGRASVTFDLPDNLTSWRVTAQGITSDLKAGTVLHQVPVGLPFFVDVTMSNEYLVSDRPEIKVRGFGRELAPGSTVTFDVSAPTLGISEPVRVTATAFQAARVPLGELTEGEHEILIEGSAGGMEDALVRTIRVVPSRLVSGRSAFYELEDGLRPEGSSDRPTTLVFSDHERGRYAPMTQMLLWGYGDRVDQQVARDLAAELIQAYYDETQVAEPAFDVSIYQTPDGGIGLFPYADDDLALSARIAALAPDKVGRTGLLRYFLSVSENRNETRERQIIALYGLAALGEPVLVPLGQALKAEDLTWRERLYLGLAAQALGDDTVAGDVYRGLIEEFGESRAPNYRVLVGPDQDDILEATSLAAVLGAGIGDELAPALFDYTTQNYTEDILVELEQISYLEQALPRLSPEAARFAYELGGERNEVTLEQGRGFSLQLSPEELDEIELTPVEGRVGVASFYTAPLTAGDVDVDPDVAVTRTYGGGSADGVVLEEGELLQVTLTATFGPQALDGCYQTSDLLPSGLRAVTSPYSWGFTFGSHPYQIEGQRVSFCLSDTPLGKVATYYARVVSAGAYTAEPVVIQSMQSAESINLSDAAVVEVR